MRVLVTGGCGYKGSVLVPKLLKLGHQVTVVDTQWFGVNLAEHAQLRVVKGDLRCIDEWKHHLNRQDAVIHLAGIANDPCGELDSKLTWEVNVLGTLFLAEAAAQVGVSQLIFASSASVYGIKGNIPVTEETDLTPVSDYNKTKMCAERVLLSYRRRMNIKIVRPATVCGMSPRMRLDTVVNMLTAQALTTGKIIAHCGPHGASLMRPNTHIEDITDLYCWLLTRDYDSVIFNAGFENLSVGDTATKIASIVKAEFDTTEVQDKRSYCVDSSRLLDAGFKPQHTVEDAIRGIVAAHESGELNAGDPRMINLHWMRSQGLVRDVA